MRFFCVFVRLLLGIPPKTTVKVSKSGQCPQLAQVAVVPDLLSCANCPPTLICMIGYVKLPRTPQIMTLQLTCSLFSPSAASHSDTIERSVL